MKGAYVALLSFSALLLSSQPSVAHTSSKVIRLNNEGVDALKTEDFRIAIDKLTAALNIDPGYRLARTNLSTAHNNYGLAIRDENKIEALKHFEQAQYLLENDHPVVQANLLGMMRVMGKDPDSFTDRVELGNQDKLEGDLVGAVVQYRAALKLKRDPEIHRRLVNVYRLLKVLDNIDNPRHWR
jgi:tetratricopeptide (TPR) repeat protein